jgi:hypothetical protein
MASSMPCVTSSPKKIRPSATRSRPISLACFAITKDRAKKYDWDIDPEDANHPTIHGLRGTGILARAEQGYEADQIANNIGMSRQNVDHYMRFRDQVKTADAGQRRLKLVSKED